MADSGKGNSMLYLTPADTRVRSNSAAAIDTASLKSCEHGMASSEETIVTLPLNDLGRY